MIMMNRLFLLIFLFSFSAIDARVLDLGYDKAVSLAQKGNWEEAKDLFKKMLVDRSQEPDFLYDSGVASFKTKDFKQAGAYFQSVTENDYASDSLKEQAYFNLGNTNVELQNLKEAVKNYEDVLKINPENEKAKYNLEILKKMLEQQQQQQKQKEQKDQKKDQEKDKKDKQKDKQQQGQQKQNQKKSDKQKQEQSQDRDEQERKDSSGQDEQKKYREQPRSDEKRSEDGQDEQRDKGEPSKNELYKKRDDKQRDMDKHDKKPEQKKQTKQHDKDDKTEKDKDQAEPMPAGMQKRKDLDERTMQILQAVEKMDKEGNKEFMKATVSKEMVGKYGQNRW